MTLLPQPENRDYDGHVRRGKWVAVTGTATCGCLWTIHILQESSAAVGLSFRECFDLFGAQFTIGVHNYEHADACLKALPRRAYGADVRFSSDMTLRELLEAT